MMHSVPVSARDQLIIDAVDRGDITTAPLTGQVWYQGREARTRSVGYVVFSNRTTSLSAHRAMWISVHGPIAPGLVINHRNGVKDDNRIDNLEAITQKQNLLHARRDPHYVGTFPDDDATIDPAFRAMVMELAQRGDVTRAELLALVGKTTEAADVRYGRADHDVPTTRANGHKVA